MREHITNLFYILQIISFIIISELRTFDLDDCRQSSCMCMHIVSEMSNVHAHMI